MNHAKELLHFLRRGFQRRQVTGEFVHGLHPCVPQRWYSLIAASNDCLPDNASVERGRAEFGVKEGVHDSLPVMKSRLYPASPTNAQPGPYGLQK